MTHPAATLCVSSLLLSAFLDGYKMLLKIYSLQDCRSQPKSK
jgi:hypothetical protein